jgi:putative colanic acid biosynthesis UDP-glucose lipid carrier transferase
LAILEQLAKKASATHENPASAGSGAGFRLLEFPLDRPQTPSRGDEAPPRASRLTAAAKRGLDLTIAIALLVGLAPLLLAIALVIRFESAGPALFRQRRLGLNGKTFRIFKFRSMHVLEDGEQVRQAEPGDTRITRVGRFLRASSLDELPQLVNVVLGEMSLVGPRPHAIAHDRQYGVLIADYALRRRVKPGITGWAQINGLRGPTPTIDMMRRRVDHDVWYVQNESVSLDLKIMLRTPRELFRRRNAF